MLACMVWGGGRVSPRRPRPRVVPFVIACVRGVGFLVVVLETREHKNIYPEAKREGVSIKRPLTYWWTPSCVPGDVRLSPCEEKTEVGIPIRYTSRVPKSGPVTGTGWWSTALMFRMES